MSKISIITPSFNSSKFIEETIQSVIAQTYGDWEMIIVDDCSTDKSCEIIQNYSNQDKRIKLVMLDENSGAAIARNRAIEESHGRYIAFLDADDLWEPTKLQKQLKVMQDNNYEFTYTTYSAIDESGTHLSKNLNFAQKVSYHDLLKTCSIGCLTVMIDREKFTDISMPLIRRGQDYALWLKLLKQVEYAYCVNEKLAQYRVVTNSLSRNKIKKLKGQWFIYRKIENLSLWEALFYIVQYGHYGFKKNR